MSSVPGIFLIAALLFGTVDSPKEQALELFNNGEEQEALEIYSEIVDEHSEDVEIVWKTAMLYARVGNRIEDEEVREHHLQQAEFYAEQALSLDDNNADVHFTYAVVMARIAEHSSKRKALAKAEKIRTHSEKALEIDPEHGKAMHVLGMWHQRMANLSFFERTVIRALFGGVPDGASNEEAEKLLREAVEHEPDMILYRMDLARFYEQQGKDEKARQTLSNVEDMKPRFKMDPKHKREAAEMLASL